MKTGIKIAIAVGCLIVLVAAYYFLFVKKKGTATGGKRSDNPAFAPNSELQVNRASIDMQRELYNSPSVTLE